MDARASHAAGATQPEVVITRVFDAPRGPDGNDYWMRRRFREIAEPGGKTTLTVRQTVPVDASMARGQRQGCTESLVRLADYLAKS